MTVLDNEIVTTLVRSTFLRRSTRRPEANINRRYRAIGFYRHSERACWVLPDTRIEQSYRKRLQKCLAYSSRAVSETASSLVTGLAHVEVHLAAKDSATFLI